MIAAIDNARTNASRFSGWGRWIPLAVVGVVSLAWLGTNLSGRYLWQDEAVTAVLGERMIKYGRPLAYDGRNLITMDVSDHLTADEMDRTTRDPQDAIAYFAERGDFKPDSEWTGQPWGPFLVAGLSLKLLGHDTWQARLPFVLAGAFTVALLWWLIVSRTGDSWMATLAALALLGNLYWFLHVRQCRYYALTSLGLLLTIVAYLRWQEGRSWGRSLFILAACLWFQCDYGTFWPVMGVLFMDSLWPRKRSGSTGNAPPSTPAHNSGRSSRLSPVAVFTVLGLIIAPFVWYYELASRGKPASFSRDQMFLISLFNVNQFVLPILLVVFVLLVRVRFRTRFPGSHRVMWLLAGIVGAVWLWVPLVAPAPYMRYLVALVPLGSWWIAWASVRLADVLVPPARPLLRPVVSGGIVAAWVLTGLVSNGVAKLIPSRYYSQAYLGEFMRPELAAFHAELVSPPPDPNRAVVEALRPHLRPGDEILVTYGDAPLMFYTDCRIRGGIPCFRLDDPSGSPPRWAVLRTKTPFKKAQAERFERAFARYHWKLVPSDGPDTVWGNNPDPMCYYARLPEDTPRLQVFERVDPRQDAASGLDKPSDASEK